MNAKRATHTVARRLQFVTALTVLAITLGFGAHRLIAYATEGHVWGVTQIPYYVNPTNIYVATSDAITAVQSAASNWNTQSGGANIQLAYAGTTSTAVAQLDYTNNVFFRNDSSSADAETYYWWDGSGHLIDADVILHENYIWYTHVQGGCETLMNGLYVENAVTHEFGHVQGLAHSSVSTATMWPYTTSCETIRESLDPDDVSGIQYLYPPKTSTTSTTPAAPSNLSATDSSSSPSSAIGLAWTNNATNASGYNVLRGTNGVNFSQVAQLGSSATSYTDSGLASGTTYYYQVAAYNSSGSASSNTASAQTQVAASSVQTAPAAPYNPSPANGATNVNTNVTLSWSDSGATSYTVYLNGAVYASNLTSASVSLSSLANSTTYSWMVTATNSVGSTSGPTWSFTTKAARGRKK